MLPAKMIAFWKYDSYPFILCGTITKMNERGMVETEEFGPGHTFKPIRILPYESGVEMRAELKALEQKRNAELAWLEKKYTDALKDLWGE